MSSSSVWVQLYIKGENEPKGQPVEIEPIPKNIGALIKATKTTLQPCIDYAPVNQILIYAAGTDVADLTNTTALKAWAEIPSNSSGPEPLIVVAPKPPPVIQQQVSSKFDAALIATTCGFCAVYFYLYVAID